LAEKQLDKLEKKWKKEDLFNGALLADAITHVVLVVLISGAIVLVGAIVLNPTGTAIKAPAQLAELLVPIMGTAARFIMGIALVGAGFSSLLGNTQRGVVLLGAGIDKEYGLETKFVRYGCLICIVVAALICFSYGGSPTQLIFIANVLTSIATPTAGFFILRLIFRKDVNEGYGTPKVLQWGMVVCYVFACLMTVSGLSTQIPNLLRSFGLIA
jgi:Mn2+/Fe2+ NRAMP family transporter